jgi:hypothetical protein
MFFTDIPYYILGNNRKLVRLINDNLILRIMLEQFLECLYYRRLSEIDPRRLEIE